jgi:hypothetical protein
MIEYSPVKKGFILSHPLYFLFYFKNLLRALCLKTDEDKV